MSYERKLPLPDLCRYNDGVVCERYAHYNCHRCGFSKKVHDKRVAKIRAELNGVEYVETEEQEEIE